MRGLDKSMGPGSVTVKVVLTDGREVTAQQVGGKVFVEGQEVASSEIRDILRSLQG